MGRVPDDETALQLVLAGEREMFVPLLKRHYESVLLLCRRILGSDADAQDAAQEAALQAFLGLGRLREPRQFGAWLHSIAANLARSALRRRRLLSLESLEGGVGSGPSLVDVAPTPEEVRFARELHDAVLAALNELSSVNRGAVVGYYLQGYSYAELAVLWGVPVSTIKGRLHKGRRQLAPLLAPVAREVFGTGDEKEDQMEARETIEVTVDDVIKMGLKDERWTKRLRAAGSLDEMYERWAAELPRAAGSMGEPRGLLDAFFAHESAPAVVVLREAGGERVLPVWMGFETGLSVWLSVSGRRMPRPMTHNLMRQLMETVGFKVESVAVNRLAEGVFYGEITLSHDEQSYRVDAKPSDTIALATRLEAPIYVARSVLEEGGYESKRAWLDLQGEDLGLG